MQTKMLDLVVNHPAGPLFDPTAQILVAAGLVVFLVLWGVAKIISVRNPGSHYVHNKVTSDGTVYPAGQWVEGKESDHGNRPEI